MSLLQEGQVIAGTYEVERLLGEGAFGEVYRVKHRFLGRQAMKVFKSAGFSLKEVEAMLGEAILLSRLAHPNIVRVFDANLTETSKGLCGFFTMEYVAGGTLEHFWRSHEGKFVPVEKTVDIITQVCRGLAVAHGEKLPIIHRDIKPQNILVGYDEAGLRVRLTDFGLAKQVNPLSLLATGVGTLAFKPPEVLRGIEEKHLKNDSCAGDIWAVGTTLYFLLTDRFPYADLRFDPTDTSRFQRPLILPSRVNPRADPALDQIVERALATRPVNRYQNALEMLNEISRWNRPIQEPISSEIGASPVPMAASKLALGPQTPANQEDAHVKAARAIELSRHPNRLSEAADLMEEAFNQWPDLRERYEYRLKLWRKGISS
jgi:serine/threonine-protein kinase